MTSIHNSNLPDSGRQAPSERHLEDYLWNHPEAFGVFDEDTGPISAGTPRFELIARQYPTSVGRIDLVMQDWRLWLVELKKGPIDANAVVQILRYMSYMRSLWDDLLWDYYEQKDENWQGVLKHDITNGSYYDQLVRGLLVGYSLKDKNLLIACAEANVDVLLYRYSNNQYWLVSPNESVITRAETWHERQGKRRERLQSLLGMRARELLRNELPRRATAPAQFDAASAANEYVNEIDDLDGEA